MGQAIPDYPVDLFSHESVRNARAVDDTLREFSPVVRLADGKFVGEIAESFPSVRPEQITLTPDADGRWQVASVEYLGHESLVTVRLPDAEGLELITRCTQHESLTPGTRTNLAVNASVRAWAIND